MSSNNSHMSSNRSYTDRDSLIAPSSNCTTSYFYHTVLEEDSIASSQASSENEDEHDDTTETFVRDVEFWSPIDGDLPTVQEKCLSPLIHRNTKPRRRLPMITTAISKESSTNQSKVEKGSCSFDSGISRLLSSVDRAVSSVTSKTNKKFDESKPSQSLIDERPNAAGHSALSHIKPLPSCQSPPIPSLASTAELTPKSPSRRINSSCLSASITQSTHHSRSNFLHADQCSSNPPISPTLKGKHKPTLFDSRRYSDHDPIVGSPSSISVCVRTHSPTIVSLKSSSPSRSINVSYTNSNRSSPTILQNACMLEICNECPEERHSQLDKNSPTRTQLKFSSPPLSPTVIYCGQTPRLSPKPTRIGRRMLPEPPKQTIANQNLPKDIKDVNCHKECTQLLSRRQHSPIAQLGECIEVSSSSNVQCSDNAKAIGTTSSSVSLSTSPRPPLMQQFFSNLVASSRDSVDRSMYGGLNASSGSNTTTPSSAVTGATWASISSRDSVDSGFFSTGHSRSTTCDSTSSNNSGASKASVTLGEMARNPPSPISNGVCRSQVFNESPPPYTRQYKWRRSYGVCLPEVPYASSDSPNEEFERTCSFKAPSLSKESNDSTAQNSTVLSTYRKFEGGLAKSTPTSYNRVQSLPSQDSPDKFRVGCAQLQHQQSLPTTTYLSRSSQILKLEQNSNKPLNSNNRQPFSRNNNLGLRVHFDKMGISSYTSNEFDDQENCHEILNNQRNHGAHARLNSPLCDNNFSYSDSGHHNTCEPSNDGNHGCIDSKLYNNLSFVSTKNGNAEMKCITLNNKNLNENCDYFDSSNIHHKISNLNLDVDLPDRESNVAVECSPSHLMGKNLSSEHYFGEPEVTTKINLNNEYQHSTNCVKFKPRETNSVSGDISGYSAAKQMYTLDESISLDVIPEVDICRKIDLKDNNIVPLLEDGNDLDCPKRYNFAKEAAAIDVLDESNIALCGEIDFMNAMKDEVEEFKPFALEEEPKTSAIDHNSFNQCGISYEKSLKFEVQREDLLKLSHNRHQHVLIHEHSTFR